MARNTDINDMGQATVKQSFTSTAYQFQTAVINQDL